MYAIKVRIMFMENLERRDLLQHQWVSPRAPNLAGDHQRNKRHMGS